MRDFSLAAAIEVIAFTSTAHHGPAHELIAISGVAGFQSGRDLPNASVGDTTLRADESEDVVVHRIVRRQLKRGVGPCRIGPIPR